MRASTPRRRFDRGARLVVGAPEVPGVSQSIPPPRRPDGPLRNRAQATPAARRASRRGAPVQLRELEDALNGDVRTHASVAHGVDVSFHRHRQIAPGPRFPRPVAGQQRRRAARVPRHHARARLGLRGVRVCPLRASASSKAWTPRPPRRRCAAGWPACSRTARSATSSISSRQIHQGSGSTARHHQGRPEGRSAAAPSAAVAVIRRFLQGRRRAGRARRAFAEALRRPRVRRSRWAHDDSLDLLAYLVDSLRAPILLVCVSRPELLARRDDWAKHGGEDSTSSICSLLRHNHDAAVMLSSSRRAATGTAVEDLVDAACNLAGGNSNT